MRKLYLLTALCLLFCLHSLQAQVSVTASAGTAGPTVYTTVNAAFTAINAGTHQGDVVITITGNTTEPATPVPLLKSATPSSYTSILIKPQGNDTIFSAAAPTSSRGLLELHGADNVTIDGDDPATPGSRNLVLQVATNANTNAVVVLGSKSTTGTDGATNITIKNCVLIGNRTSATSTTTTYGIVFSNNASAATISAGSYSNTGITIENNEFKRAYHAIYAAGTSATYLNSNLIIRRNIIGSPVSADNIGIRGIYLSYTAATAGSSSALIEANDIRAGENGVTGFASSVAGIEINSANAGTIIRNNNIHDIRQPSTSGYYAIGVYINSATSNSDIQIYNNFIRDMVAAKYTTSISSYSNYGIYFSSAATNTAINHNTIALQVEPTTGTTANQISACIGFSSSTATVANIRNNIFVNTINSTNSYGIYTSATSNISAATVNNNAYYVTAGKVGYYNAAAATTLAAWKTATSKDAAAVSTQPAFISSTDLHINGSLPSALESGGTTIATINTDIDGDSRPGPAGSVNGGGTASDIGADEFDGKKLVTIDIKPDSLVTPAGKLCNTAAVPVRVKVRNAGTSTLDFSVNNLTVNATVTGAASANFTASLNTGTLAPDATTYIDLTPTVSMMNGGSYNFTVITQLTGDLAASNDTLRVSASVDTSVTLPQIVNFTGYTGNASSLSTAFPGWNEGSGAVTPVIGGDGSFTSTSATQQTFYGSVGAKMNLYSTNVGWIISPKFVPTAAHKFKYKAAVVAYNATTSANLGTNDTVRAVVSTDCGVTWTTLREFTAANANGLGSTNALTSFEEDLSAYAGQPIRVAIYARRTPTSTTPDIDIVIDDIVIDLPTVCFEPTALALSSLADTTATITWTDPTTGTPANGYQIYISTNNTAPTSATVPTYTGVNVNTYTFNGLQPNTTYYVWIKSNCGTDGTSLWSNPVTFKTFCTTVTSFSENFDAVSTSVFPSCWAKVGTNGSANLQSSNPNSSPNTLYIYSGSGTSQAVVAMPPVSNLDAGTHRLKFKARANSTVGGIIEVGYLTNPIDASTFTSFTSITASALTYQDYEVIPSGSTGGAKVMAFRHTGSPANSVLIDDVKWEAIPTCEIPNTLTKSNLTSTSVTIQWNAPSVTSPVSYDLYYSTSNTAPTGATTPSQSAITNTSASISNLSASTKYYFWVRSFCGGADYSLWTNIDSFTTTCSPISSFPWTENFESVTTPALPSCFTALDVNNDGDKWITYTTYGTSGSIAAGLYTDFNSGANNDYLVLPPMTLTGNQRLRFSVRARSSSEPNDYQVVLSTTGNAPADFTNVIKPLTTVSNTTHAFIDWIDLSAYTGTVNIAIHVPQGGLDGYYLYVDDIRVENIPTCEVPTTFVKSNLTATGVTIDWTAPTIGTPVSYDVHYSLSNTAPTGSTTPTNPAINANTVTLNSLSANTKYYYWIRSFCGGSDYSGWSAVDSFTTMCSSVTAFAENFDGVSTSVFPSCWYKVGTSGSAYLQTTNPNSTPNTLYIYSSSTSNRAVVAMPPISNLDAGTHRLRFKARASGTVGGIIEVGYLTNPLDASTFAAITTVTASSLTYQDYQVIPTGTTGATVMAFRHSGSPTNSVLIDDVKWEAIPTCEVPNTFVKTNITSTSATIEWTAPSLGTPVNYDLYYSTTNTVPTGSTTPSQSAITATSVNLSNLTANTKYYFWVRTFCGGSDYSSWTVIDSFTTECVALSLPITEGFNSATVPSCWKQQYPNGTAGSTDLKFVASSSNPSTTPQEGGYYVFFNSYSSPYTAGKETRLVSPILNTSSINSVDVSFYWFAINGSNYNSGSYLNEGVTVQYSLDGNTWTDAQFVARHDATASSSGEWKKILVTIPAAGNQSNVYLGFKFHSEYGYNCSLDNVKIEATTTLPVTIAEFTGKREGSVNKLQWITSTEANNAGFDVERSTDGNNFSKIAFVASQAVNGNSSSKLVYNTVDETVLSGGAYYRLKQLDKDGKSQYSKVIHIKGALTTKLDIVNLYPNPVKHVLNVAISAPANNKVRFVITDLSGRTVAEESRMITAGENIVTLNTTAFLPGTYIIKAVCADGCETAVRKLIKQ